MSRDPRFVGALLESPLAWGLARLALVSAYLLGAAVKLSDWPAAVAEQAHFGLAPPAVWAAVTIGVELVGPLLILSGRWVWLGAGMLGVFTGLAALIANNFWALSGPARFAATNAFFEHLGLIAGFVLAALIAEHDQRQQARAAVTPSNP